MVGALEAHGKNKRQTQSLLYYQSHGLVQHQLETSAKQRQTKVLLSILKGALTFT